MEKNNTMANGLIANYLIANYHTHTKRCGHACGEDREYVESAIEAGIKYLGFSDHTPYPTGFKSIMRIPVEETQNYFDSIMSLKKEYKNDIEIYAGVEAEYFPEHFDRLTEYLKDYPLDYMILGNHFVDDEEHGFYVGEPFTEKKYMDMYVENVIKGIQSKKFVYVAHPDLPNYVGADEKEVKREALKKIAAEAKKNNVLMEVNVLGYKRGQQYPSTTLFEVCEEMGNDMIFGLDIHNPKHFRSEQYVWELKKILEKYSINIIDKLDI